MTKQDVEMALIQMGKAMQTIVGAYSPNANHMSITVIDGNINVSAYEYDDEKGAVVEEILDAIQFKDGTLCIGGKYIRPAHDVA